MTTDMTAGDLEAEEIVRAPTGGPSAGKGRGRRRRWSDAEVRALIDLANQPGSSVPEVAKAFGVSASRLYGWRRQLAAEGLGDDEQALPVFAQVEVSEPIAQRELTAGFLDDCAPAPAIGSVVVDLPSGARVRIEGIADPGVIAAVLGELDR
jgi:transposase